MSKKVSFENHYGNLLSSNGNGHLNGTKENEIKPNPVGIKKTENNSSILHVLRVLSMFNKLFQKNLRFRDRSVKAIQYGCQMLSGRFTHF